MSQGKKRAKPKSSRGKARPGKVVHLDIGDVAHGGQGLGTIRGQPVFVPYTLPGEAIAAELTGGRGKALFARGLRLKAASADRVEPRCPHFGPDRCWGCHWQHIAYAAQPLLKQDVLADQLARVGRLPDALIEAALRPLPPAPEPWAYNHSLSLLRAETGGWGLRRQGRGIETIDDCLLAHPDLIALLRELDLDFPQARRLTLRRGTDGRVMLIFEIEAEAAPELQTDLPVSVNMILPDKEPVNLIGDAHSRFEIAGRSFRVTAGAYIRANVGGIEKLVESVIRAARLTGGERALDLYAGVGLFSAFLADQAEVVTLVESYPPAASDADANLADYDHVDVIEGSVENVLADIVDEGASYDVALVDPPSAGLSDAVVRRLRKLNLERIVYISGDPASLARDCKRLIGAEFKLREIQPLDLAPQTYYITAVARFEA